jgi:class 3 adenylate cyclase
MLSGAVGHLQHDIIMKIQCWPFMSPLQVMLLLHELFSKYDHLCKRYGIYKVETIGDCYMACSGLLVDNPDHAQHMVQFAKAMLGAAASVRNPLGGSVHIRVGVHSGRVMSGIVGSIRARYCLFGDTVNTASRMESTGMVDRIQVRPEASISGGCAATG